MSYLIAIDQSTSATKVVLFDANGQAQDVESLPHEQHHPQPGWVEHDANEIWANLLQAARNLVARHQDIVEQIRGIALTNQRETVLVIDRESGVPLGPAIVWQCRRSDAICREFTEAGHDKWIEAKTGLKLDSYFSASKVTWLLREQPELKELLQSGNAAVANIDAYLIHRLTGGAVFATDHTNASRTLLFHLESRSWDQQLCELFGVPMQALPEIRESFSEFGVSDLNGILPRPIPICGVMGDSQASLFSHGCFAPGDTKATFGTGTSVMMNTGPTCTASDQGMVSALAWVLNGTPTYALEGLINYSAATIAWLKDSLGLLESASQSAELAAAVADNGGVYLVPAFSGMGAPYWSPTARAAIVGMTGHTRKEHIVRAGLESIAYQIGDVLEAMSSAGVTPTVIRADGGPTQNALLMQMVADFTQLGIVTMVDPNNSARGAAMAGLLGLGVVESLSDLAELPHDSQTYDPVMSAADAKSLFAGWHLAVQRVL